MSSSFPFLIRISAKDTDQVEHLRINCETTLEQIESLVKDFFNVPEEMGIMFREVSSNVLVALSKHDVIVPNQHIIVEFRAPRRNVSFAALTDLTASENSLVGMFSCLQVQLTDVANGQAKSEAKLDEVAQGQAKSEAKFTEFEAKVEAIATGLKKVTDMAFATLSSRQYTTEILDQFQTACGNPDDAPFEAAFASVSECEISSIWVSFLSAVDTACKSGVKLKVVADSVTKQTKDVLLSSILSDKVPDGCFKSEARCQAFFVWAFEQLLFIIDPSLNVRDTSVANYPQSPDQKFDFSFVDSQTFSAKCARVMWPDVVTFLELKSKLLDPTKLNNALLQVADGMVHMFKFQHRRQIAFAFISDGLQIQFFHRTRIGLLPDASNKLFLFELPLSARTSISPGFKMLIRFLKTTSAKLGYLEQAPVKFKTRLIPADAFTSDHRVGVPLKPDIHFVTPKDLLSVPYAVKFFDNTRAFDMELGALQALQGCPHAPILAGSDATDAGGAIAIKPIAEYTLRAIDNPSELAFSHALFLEVVIAALDVIPALHAAGFVHGDMSPNNILLVRNRSTSTEKWGVWINDFSCSFTIKQVSTPVPYFGTEPYSALSWLIPEIQKPYLPIYDWESFAWTLLEFSYPPRALPFWLSRSQRYCFRGQIIGSSNLTDLIKFQTPLNMSLVKLYAGDQIAELLFALFAHLFGPNPNSELVVKLLQAFVDQAPCPPQQIIWISRTKSFAANDSRKYHTRSQCGSSMFLEPMSLAYAQSLFKNIEICMSCQRSDARAAQDSSADASKFESDDE